MSEYLDTSTFPSFLGLWSIFRPVFYNHIFFWFIATGLDSDSSQTHHSDWWTMCLYIIQFVFLYIYSPLTHCRFFQNYSWSEQEVRMSVSNGGLGFSFSYQEQIVVDVTLTTPLAPCLVFPNAVPPGTHMRLRKDKVYVHISRCKYPW